MKSNQLKASTPTTCGSRGLAPCPSGQSCINDPNKPGCSTAVDCPGICATLDGPTCGGFAGLQCPDPLRQICVDNPNDSCNPQNGGADCSGICVYPDGSSAAPPKYPSCGGLQGLQCPRRSQHCVEDPRNCPLAADCLGICVGPELSVCGGIAGRKCPKTNQICVDDPRDSCDPGAGGRDCQGICV